MAHKITHTETLVSLRKIEGQVKGIQKMIDDQRYCMDIATQIHACINALYTVGEKVLAKHMEHCVVDALKGKSESDKMKKINEIMDVMKRLRKL